MSKASEEDLAILHSQVARTLTAVLQPVEIEGSEVQVASAAHIMAAITFLKNNNITADAGANDDLMAFNKALTARRKDRKLTMTDIEAAADKFERDLGGHMQ
jgi:hypothetical protein